MAKPKSAIKILPLTSVRFFAALYVAVGHGYGVVPLLRGLSPYWLQFLELKYAAVNFFFVLSGYILAIVYLRDADSPTAPPLNRRRFWVSRLARIYPLYLAAMLLDLPHSLHVRHLMLALGTWHTNYSWAIVLNLVLLQAWFTHAEIINVPAWSLSDEAFFYGTFPWLAPRLFKLSTRSVLVWMVVLYLLGNVAVLAFGYLHTTEPTWRCNPALNLFEFLLGILVARLHLNLNKQAAWEQRLRNFAPALFLASLAGYFALVAVTPRLPYQLMTHGFFSLLFCCAILALAAGNQALDSVFSAPWLVLLGEASYALYLLHLPIFYLMRASLERYGGPMFCAYLLICILASIASFWWLETPSRRWVLRMANQGSQESTTAAAAAQ